MRKFLILAVLFSLFAGHAEARIKIRIPVDNSIPKVATLPDSSYYRTSDGQHLDLGYIEENGKRVLVLFSTSKPDTYYDINDDYAEAIREDLNVEDLATLIPEPTFWDKYGTNIIVYGIIGLAILGALSYMKDFLFALFGIGKKKKN